MSEQQILPLEGTVSAVAKKDGDPTGIQLEEFADQWWNFSKVIYRDKPYDIPEKGDRIAMGVQGGKWIKWIQVAPVVRDETAATENVQVTWGSNRHEFATSTRDASIQKQVALKAAVEFTIGIWRAAVDGTPNPDTVLMAATKFNDWLIGDTNEQVSGHADVGERDDGDPGPSFE